MIIKRIILITAMAFFICSFVCADDEPRGEVSFTVGYTLADGITGDSVRGPDGKFYDTISPKDSMSFGGTVEFFLIPNWEAGFIVNRQQSQLEVSGINAAPVVIGDMIVDGYYGTLSYNFRKPGQMMRPFVLGAIGLTHYGSVNFTGIDGLDRTIDGHLKFGGTFGGGIKLYPTNIVGLRLQVLYSPTYIRSGSSGWWCDPYYGCYLTQSIQYSNQFEMAAGVTVKF